MKQYATKLVARMWILVVLVATLSACASGGLVKPQAPTVSLAGMQLVSMGLAQQTIRLNLNLGNPNSFMLPLRGMSYGLKLNGISFLQGTSTDQINIPAGGQSGLSIDLSTNVLSWFSDPKYAGLLSGKALDYELTGSVSLLSQGLKLPFTKAGSVALQR